MPRISAFYGIVIAMYYDERGRLRVRRRRAAATFGQLYSARVRERLGRGLVD